MYTILYYYLFYILIIINTTNYIVLCLISLLLLSIFIVLLVGNAQTFDSWQPANLYCIVELQAVMRSPGRNYENEKISVDCLHAMPVTRFYRARPDPADANHVGPSEFGADNPIAN